MQMNERILRGAFFYCHFYTEVSTMMNYENFKKSAEEKGTANGLFDMISDVFYMGVAVGARNA